MKYLAVYKCPLCNKLVATTTDAKELTREDINNLLSKVITNQQFMGNPYLYQVPMHISHNCADGSVGLAQFAGLKIQ